MGPLAHGLGTAGRRRTAPSLWVGASCQAYSQQAIKCPGTGSSSGGSSTLQVPSIILAQRGWNRQPDGNFHHMEIMMPDYHKLWGWDEQGVPRPERLARLGLA